MADRESWQEREARRRKDSEQRLRTACAVLTRLGVRTVEVAYDGAGDEGFIQKIDYDPVPPAGIPEGLREQVEDYASNHLPGGWEINAGSYGKMVIDARTATADLDHHWRLDEDEQLEEDLDEDLEE